MKFGSLHIVFTHLLDLSGTFYTIKCSSEHDFRGSAAFSHAIIHLNLPVPSSGYLGHFLRPLARPGGAPGSDIGAGPYPAQESAKN